MKQILLIIVTFFLITACSYEYKSDSSGKKETINGVNTMPIPDQQLNSEMTYTNLDDALKNPLKVYKLYLAGKKLTHFPLQILTLKNLQTLDLNHNKLKTIPKEISQLKNLQRISLEKNKIKWIPKEIGQLNHLQELVLSQNKLRRLPKEISQLKQLKTLILAANHLSRKEQKKIKRLLPKCEIIFKYGGGR